MGKTSFKKFSPHPLQKTLTQKRKTNLLFGNMNANNKINNQPVILSEVEIFPSEERGKIEER